jgi:hypothetical protein
MEPTGREQRKEWEKSITSPVRAGNEHNSAFMEKPQEHNFVSHVNSTCINL